MTALQDQHETATETVSPTELRGLSNRVLLVVLAILGSIIFGITAYALTHFVEGLPRNVSVIFALVVMAALSLSILVVSRLVDVFRSSKAGIRGARLHQRLVLLLSLVAVIPATIAFALSGTILQAFSDEYFVDRVTDANLVARDFANGYVNAESQKMGLQVIQLSRDLALQAQAGLNPEQEPIGFRLYLLGQTVLRGFSAVVLLDNDRQIVAEVSPLPNWEYRLPPAQAFADISVPGATPYKFDTHNRADLDGWYAIYRMSGTMSGYLIAYQAEAPTLSQQLVRVREFRDQTADVRDRLADLSQTFAIGYGLVMALLLLSAVWIGLLVANTVVGPVRRLANAAVAVSEGNLQSRVDVRKGDGELGDLGHAFNDMTRQLEAQRDGLITANSQSEERRRFIETVLSGVPAGVMNIRPDGRVALANPAAEAILGGGKGRLVGQSLDAIATELGPLLERARQSTGGDARDQVELNRAGHARIINVQISPNDPQGNSGYVITLDDITELVSAQRNAAWGEVARRIAHEIKNPLTPIQLSAERLKRRYGESMGEDREIFDKCTDTIIRHVGDIGRMVNEFSSFARMPEPIMTREDLCEIARSSAFSFAVANAEISFEYDLPDDPVMALCDGRLVGQAVVNLVKNAVEAITESTEPKEGKIIVRVAKDEAEARIEVIDNGKGLPKKDRARLTEPYMTTRVKGTGLGLAIVRKAIEEHGGRFALIDSGSDGKSGATARITLPLQVEKSEADGEGEASMPAQSVHHKDEKHEAVEHGR